MAVHQALRISNARKVPGPPSATAPKTPTRESTSTPTTARVNIARPSLPFKGPCWSKQKYPHIIRGAIKEHESSESSLTAILIQVDTDRLVMDSHRRGERLDFATELDGRTVLIPNLLHLLPEGWYREPQQELVDRVNVEIEEWLKTYVRRRSRLHLETDDLSREG